MTRPGLKPIRYLSIASEEYEAQINYFISHDRLDRAIRFKAEMEKAEIDIQKKPKGYKTNGEIKHSVISKCA